MWAARAGVAVLGRPRLWLTAIRQVLVLAKPGWWRSAPFLPLPDEDYLRFRLQTMYGGTAARAEATDVVAYLEWCRVWPAVSASK
jgi:hypothetical protein